MPHRKFKPSDDRYAWDHVERTSYKEEGAHFTAITRQVLFDEGLPAQVRYFEIEPGGYSSFEKHEHVHAVMTLHGLGQAIVGEEVFELAPYDLVYVPPNTWHQFLAGESTPLGFICMVDCNRDRPVRPTEKERSELKKLSKIGRIIRP